MVWFKVDDTFHSHPKVQRCGLLAVGLWSVCGSYSACFRTDGFVPKRFVSGLSHGTRAAAQLVAAGLWDPAERNGELGWIFHDWHDYQPSAEEVEAKRQQARERQRRHRQGDDVTRDKRVTEPPPDPDVTRESRHPDPTRPDPSPQTSVGLVDRSESSSTSELATARAREAESELKKNHERQKRRRYRPSASAPIPVGDTVASMARTAVPNGSVGPKPQAKSAKEEPRCGTCYVYESGHHRVTDHPFVRSDNQTRLVATT
jgi:hypothetical protein